MSINPNGSPEFARQQEERDMYKEPISEGEYIDLRSLPRGLQISDTLHALMDSLPPVGPCNMQNLPVLGKDDVKEGMFAHLPGASTITKIDPNDTTEQTISGRRNYVTEEILKRLPLEELGE